MPPGAERANAANGWAAAGLKRFQLVPGNRLVPATEAHGCEGTWALLVSGVTYGLPDIAGTQQEPLHREHWSHRVMHLCALLHIPLWALGLWEHFQEMILFTPLLHDNIPLRLCFYLRSQIKKKKKKKRWSLFPIPKSLRLIRQSIWKRSPKRSISMAWCDAPNSPHLFSTWHISNDLEISLRKPAEMLKRSSDQTHSDVSTSSSNIRA